MNYRADIDGLRAIAVGSVVAYHYGLPLSGGFTGVDVFFVISGFLITANLFATITAGHFSILNFYDRRLRRIMPALLVMLAVTFMAGRYFAMPGEYRDIAASTASAAFGVSNFFFLANTGYFDQAADLMPLLHTWSLAVEEQFYLLWPPVLFFIAFAGSRSNIAGVVGALFVTGFVTSMIWFGIDPKAAFFAAVPRAWELLLGALLVFLPPIQPRYANAATIAGLGLILTGFIFVKSADFPGPNALYPCLGSGLVIWPRIRETRVATGLGLLRPIGLLSYSLYLWHWPVWVFARLYLNNGHPGPRETVTLVLISLGLSYLSYRFVEQPVRRLRTSPARTVQITLACCSGLFIMAMYVTSKNGLPERIANAPRELQSLEVMWNWPCTTSRIDDNLPPFCKFGADWNSGRRAVLWGDSNAEHLGPLLATVASKFNYSVALSGQCVPVLNNASVILREPNAYNENCKTLNSALIEKIISDPSIDTVIFSASWSSFILGMAGPGKAPVFENSMSVLIKLFIEAGKRVVLIKTVPHWTIDPIPCTLLNVGLLRKQCKPNENILSSASNKDRTATESAIFARLGAVYPTMKIIDPSAALCTTPACVIELNGEFLYRDASHFRRNLSSKTSADLGFMMRLEAVFE